MDTALYYTFSTLAQALASAMALLSAFALYRLSAINDECVKLATLLEGDTGGGTTVAAMAYVGNWAGVVAEIKRRLQSGTGDANVVSARCSRIDLLISAHRAVQNALWFSLGLTAVVVAAAITVLAKTPCITVSGNAPIALYAGIAATVACLASYIYLVFEAFRGVRWRPPVSGT